MTPIKPTLDKLFLELISNFSHLLNNKPQTKTEFINSVTRIYCTSNPKTKEFLKSVKKSNFETIQLNRKSNKICFCL